MNLASAGFHLASDGIYRCRAFEQWEWQQHGFGTRHANPHVDITLRQIHSARVLNAAGLRNRECEGDALVTGEIARSIGVRTADCVPILLLDTGRRAVAAVHAGWRGTAAKIVAHAIDKMRADFNTAPAELYAAIGPSIRVCCYEVGPEVAEHFGLSGRSNVDLPAANRQQMERAGVPSGHIFDSGLCTACDLQQFFSYRREPQDPGRMVAAIRRLA